MSTATRIGTLNDDGSVTSIFYMNPDPQHTEWILKNVFSWDHHAKELMKLGDLWTLIKTHEPKELCQPLWKVVDDRGCDWSGRTPTPNCHPALTHKDVQEFLKTKANIKYLFNGTWMVNICGNWRLV